MRFSARLRGLTWLGLSLLGAAWSCAGTKDRAAAPAAPEASADPSSKLTILSASKPNRSSPWSTKDDAAIDDCAVSACSGNSSEALIDAIRSRASAGQTMTTTVVSIDDANIVGAQLVGAEAQLGVRFAAKLASVTRDAQGAVVDGSPSAVADHIDLWTFGRDIRSRNPNWMLTATESESGAASQR